MPIRLCLPAYLALIVVTIVLIQYWWQEIKARELTVLTATMLCLAVAAIVVKTVFAWDFHIRIGEVLTMIKNSDESVISINPDKLQQRPKIPFNMFQQEETFVRRQENGYDIYGKHIIYDTAK